MEEATIREKILKILLESDHPLTVDQIASSLGLNRSESSRLYNEITHAAKTLWRQSQGRVTIIMYPPVCAKCGYIFKKIKKPKKPSRCPKCKSERILPPLFSIKKR